MVRLKTTHVPERLLSNKSIVMLHLCFSNSFNMRLFVYVSESVRGCVFHVAKLRQVRIEPKAHCQVTKAVKDFLKLPIFYYFIELC